MSEKKKAFVFDTNFIIEYKKRLDEVVKNLSTDFNVYVTQVSIDERIAQNCREAKEKFDKVEECIKKYLDIADVTMRKSFEEVCASYQADTPKAYKKIFANNIIPYDKDVTMFLEVLNRAYKKIPPFPMNEKSDHGFKDTILWLSLIKYFKDNGEKEIILVTEDKGFVKQQEKLIEEFEKETNKTIKIIPNSYYNELLEVEKAEPIVKKSETLPDFSKIREEIEEVIDALRWNVNENYFGDENWYNTFVLQKEVDASYMKVVFDGLKSTIKDHIFECSIPAFRVLDLDGRIADDTGIPMKNVEAALKIYEDILKRYPDYIEQFYVAAAAIINRSYQAPMVSLEVSDEDLPF